MISIQKDKNIFFHLLLVWVCLVSAAPFVFYMWPFHPHRLLIFVCLLLMSVKLLVSKRKVLLSQNVVIIFIIQMIFFILMSLFYSVFELNNHVFQLIACLIIFAYIQRFVGFENFAKSYIIILISMGIGGVITFFLHLFIGINPIFEVQYGPASTTFFLGLTSTNVYVNVGDFRFIRFAGFFDEPGAFALYSLFALLINKVYFNNKRYEILLISTTIFTFSMAYYIIVVLYFGLFYFRLKYTGFILILFSIIWIGYSALNNYSGDNESIQRIRQSTIERFEINEDGELSGNSRKLHTEHDKQVFLDNPFWGVGDPNLTMGSNHFTVFARFGILGSLFYYLLMIYFFHLILCLHGSFRSTCFKVILLILINLFHRPEFASAFIIVSIYTMIYKVEQTIKMQKLNQSST